MDEGNDRKRFSNQTKINCRINIKTNNQIINGKALLFDSNLK
jgi:hypothetical protein